MKGIFIVFLLAAVFAGELRGYHKEDNEIVKFIKGFVVGIGESKKLNEVITCLKTIDPIINKILEGLELIISQNYTDVIKGFDIIIGALKLLFKTFDSCLVAHKLFQSLIYALQNRPI